MWSMITVAALFLLDIVIGTVLFGCIGLAAYGIWLFTNWLSSQGIPDELLSGFRFAALLTFVADVLGYLIYVVVAAVKRMRELLQQL